MVLNETLSRTTSTERTEPLGPFGVKPTLSYTTTITTSTTILNENLRKFDFTVDEGKEWLNSSREKN